MPNHRPARARRKRVTAAQTAAVHINPRGTSRPEKMAAPRSRGATIVKLRENSAARAAVLALLVSVVLPALARLLRLLSRLLLSAALLLLSWFVLAAAALLLAALARAWGVLLLLVRIPLVWIIHQISPRGGLRASHPPEHQRAAMNKGSLQSSKFGRIASAILHCYRGEFCQIRRRRELMFRSAKFARVTPRM